MSAKEPDARPIKSVHVRLHDEVSTLRRCVVFAPGEEFDRLLPLHIESALTDGKGGLRPNPDYLLFDDLVATAALSQEHGVLATVLRAAIGESNLLDLRAMLQRLLWPAAFRARVIDAVMQLERELFGQVLEDARSRLDDLPAAQLADALISGVISSSNQQVLHWPMPNWLFARDCFAVAGHAVIVGHPRPAARRRDGLLARAIVGHHEEFAGVDVIDIEAGDDGPRRCFEGGDLLLAGKDVALIGIGIRTNLAGAVEVAAQLKARGFTQVLGVRLPMRRAAMHLDTIFTFLDQRTCLYFAEAFNPASPPQDRVEVINLLDDERSLGCDLVAVLNDLGIQLQAIACGGGDPIAAKREQWTDGANAVCLGPGRALLYARNVRTLRALNEAGFEVLKPADFVRNAALLMTGERRFVVALSGFELSRGRGGPRCLTLPLSRVY